MHADEFRLENPDLNFIISLCLFGVHQPECERGELTLDGPGFVGAQHHIDHERQLRGALAERLDESQHAEVVGQVDGILGAFLFPPPYPEALSDGRDVPEST